MARVAITGPSQTGKTALSSQYMHVCHSDDFGRRWYIACGRLARAFDDPKWSTWEGVHVPHATRLWLQWHAEGKPYDELLILTSPCAPQTSNQVRQGLAVLATLNAITPDLQRRGVRVVRVL